MNQKTIEGFSLIELLVVVAIIGVLAGAGIIGYQAYISGVQTDQSINLLARTQDALDKDIIARENRLQGSSLTRQDGQLNAAITANTCESFAISTVEEMNATLTNAFGDEFPAAVYGNLISTNASGQTIGYTINPGTVIVSCADPAADVNDDPDDFRLYQCVCTATPCDFTSDADWAGDWEDDSQCARPNTANVTIISGMTPEDPNP